MTKSIFLKRFSETLQFILGFLIGIMLIAGVSGAIVFAYYAKMSILPKKPPFPEVTRDVVEPEIEPLESVTNQDLDQPTAEQEETPEADIELPPNAYRAVVTWPEGLSLRAEPEADAERIGGIEDESTIIVLKDSADGKWQHVRLPWNDQEGWIKGGNTSKVP